MFEVKKALPVWGATMKNKWNQFAGFYTKLEKPGEVTFRIGGKILLPLVCGWKHAGFGAGENRRSITACVDEIRTELKGQAGYRSGSGRSVQTGKILQ